MPKCLICNNRATGVHYGVKSCEGCKAFFKRGLSKSLNYKCYFGSTCFEREPRDNRCKACRFQKCIQVGMNLYAQRRGRKRKEGRPPVKTFGGSFPSKQRKILCTVTPCHAKNSTAVSVIVKPAATSHIQRLSETSQRSSVRHLSAESVGRFHETRGPDFALIRRCTVPKTYFKTCDEFLDDSFLALSSLEWLSLERNRFHMEDTIKTVADAVETIYAQTYANWGAFMHDVTVNGNVPHQPQLTVPGMILAVQKSVAENLRMGSRFFLLLPGFRTLGESDQKILMTEKWSETWLNNETYYLVGEHSDVHYSQYWMRQLLEAEHLKLIFHLAAKMNALHLTVLEYHLFLAVAIFHPATTTAKDKAKLSFIAAHYMKCLRHCIRSRCAPAEQTIVEEKLRGFMLLFRWVYRLGQFYVKCLNYNTRSLPFRAIRDSVPITVEEALSVEDDGLSPLLSFAC